MALYKGETVSATRIRAALAAGEMGEVAAMLGRPYSIDFEVRHGKGLGRTLGMPTINQVYPAGFQMPRLGVYVSRVQLDEHWLPSVTGLGSRPTVNDDPGSITCETFIPDFEGGLYGQKVTVELLDYIAESRRFESTGQLRAAVMAWAGEARRWFDRRDREMGETLL